MTRRRPRWGLTISLVTFIFCVMLGAMLLSGIVMVSLQGLGVVHFWRGTMGEHRDWEPLGGLVGLIGFSVVSGVILAAFFSRRALRPIRRVVSAMREVADGDFEVRVDLGGVRELEELSTSFNTMARELASTETLRRDFINDFSHEFRTPIQSLHGYAKLLRQRDLTQAERDDYLEIIIEESEHLARLSSSILQLSAFENTAIITEHQVFRLDEQIRRVIALLQPTWTAKDIDLVVDLADAYVDTDEDLSAQIWSNLLDNAFKFTPAGGRVSVRLTPGDDTVGADGLTRRWLRVEIEDNGIGVSDEARSHIFERFYQADPSRSQAGNGLGLAIVQRGVELCGARIEVASQLGQGSCFTVTMPAAAPPSPTGQPGETTDQTTSHPGWERS